MFLINFNQWKCACVGINNLGQDFMLKKLQNIKCVFRICVQLSSWTSHSTKKRVRYDQKSILVFTQRARYSCQILMKIVFSRQILEKNSNIKYYENRSSWRRRALPWGQTADGQTNDEFISRFRNFANAPKMGNLSLSTPWRRIDGVELQRR
jgi:hypothetical protein